MYSEHRAVFRDQPGRYLIAVLLIPVGIGLLMLLWWHFSARFDTLRIEPHHVIHEQGILSKDRVELQIRTIRSVRIAQTFWQRVFGTGSIYITSSGSSPEIIAHGMPHARRVRELLTNHPEPV